jgi:hypothetical protein
MLILINFDAQIFILSCLEVKQDIITNLVLDRTTLIRIFEVQKLPDEKSIRS